MRRWILTALVAAMIGQASAQDSESRASTSSPATKISEVFKQMPDSLMPYLTQNNRLDFIDFMESNMKADVTNDLGGTSQMTALTDDSISIRLNEACLMDILLLNTTHDVDSCRQVIAIVRTIGRENDIQESVEPQFYTVSWKPLPVAPQLTETDRKRLASCVKPVNILNFIKKKIKKI